MKCSLEDCPGRGAASIALNEQTLQGCQVCVDLCVLLGADINDGQLDRLSELLPVLGRLKAS